MTGHAAELCGTFDFLLNTGNPEFSLNPFTQHPRKRSRTDPRTDTWKGEQKDGLGLEPCF